MHNETNKAKLEGFLAHCRLKIDEGDKYITEEDLIEYRAIYDWLLQLKYYKYPPREKHKFKHSPITTFAKKIGGFFSTIFLGFAFLYELNRK